MPSISTTDGLRFAAQFSDGASAARHEATAVLRHGRLDVLAATDERVLASWPYDEIGIFQLRRGQPVRLTASGAPDARLTVLDPAILPPLRSRLGVVAPRPSWWRGNLALGVASVAAIVLLGWLTYAAIPLAARPLARIVPEEWEQAWGARIAAAIIAKGSGTCITADGQAALDRLVSDLSLAGGVERTFSVRVVKHEGVNALAAPGGHIVIMSGLIAEARSPDELAGVIAHEMAHGIERHPTAGVIRGVGIGLLAMWLTGDPSGLLAGAGSMLVGLSYGRADEAAADGLGTALLRGAAYGTEGMRSFLERLAAREGDAPELLSTHPDPARRALAIPAEAGRAPFDAAEWAAIKRICGSGR